MMNPELDQKTLTLVNTEVEAMQKLEHINILKYIYHGAAEYVKDNGTTKWVNFLVLEIAEGGEIFDFVAETGAFSEREARYFLKQILEGLDHCHFMGIAHRDLKPENLLLDENFNIKIADFGFAGPVNGRVGNGFSMTKLGTLNYMAPEIILAQPYNAPSVDLFATAVILFILVSGHPPMNKAQV